MFVESTHRVELCSYMRTLTTALLLGRTHASRLPAVRQREVLGHRAGEGEVTVWEQWQLEK